MDSVEKYVEYAGVFALSLLAVSAAYLVDTTRPSTFAVLLSFPLLYGFVASISTEDFNKASLISLLSIVLAPVDLFMAAASVFISITTITVSFFSSGKRFRDFYGTTALPLLITGLLLSSGIYLAAMNSSDFGATVTNTTASFIGSSTDTVVDQTGIIEMQQEQQARIVESTSRGTVTTTQTYVLNETQGQFNQNQLQSLNQAFVNARQDVPGQISSEISDRNLDIDIGSQVEQITRNLFTGKLLVLLIPVITLAAFSLQPLVGILTALMAVIITRVMDSWKEG